MLMLSLVRTPDRHRAVTSGDPDLKPFQAPAPQAAVTVGYQPNQPQERHKLVAYIPRAYFNYTRKFLIFARTTFSIIFDRTYSAISRTLPDTGCLSLSSVYK